MPHDPSSGRGRSAALPVQTADQYGSGSAMQKPIAFAIEPNIFYIYAVIVPADGRGTIRIGNTYIGITYAPKEVYDGRLGYLF